MACVTYREGAMIVGSNRDGGLRCERGVLTLAVQRRVIEAYCGIIHETIESTIVALDKVTCGHDAALVAEVQAAETAVASIGLEISSGFIAQFFIPATQHHHVQACSST